MMTSWRGAKSMMTDTDRRMHQSTRGAVDRQGSYVVVRNHLPILFFVRMSKGQTSAVARSSRAPPILHGLRRINTIAWHLGDGHLGWFLGQRVFRIVKVDINRNRISADENT